MSEFDNELNKMFGKKIKEGKEKIKSGNISEMFQKKMAETKGDVDYIKEELKDDRKKKTLIQALLILSVQILVVFYITTAIISYVIAPMMSVDIQQWIYSSSLLNRTNNKSYIDIVKKYDPMFLNNPIGNKFKSFFGNPTWQYKKETVNLNGQEMISDIVEFNGLSTIDGKESTMTIKFIIKDNKADIKSTIWYVNNNRVSYDQGGKFILDIYKEEINKIGAENRNK